MSKTVWIASFFRSGIHTTIGTYASKETAIRLIPTECKFVRIDHFAEGEDWAAFFGYREQAEPWPGGSQDEVYVEEWDLRE